MISTVNCLSVFFSAEIQNHGCKSSLLSEQFGIMSKVSQESAFLGLSRRHTGSFLPAIIRLINEIQRWIRDARRSHSDRTQMEFNALRSTLASNVKFNFLGLIVGCVCLICDLSRRWYFNDFEFIFLQPFQFLAFVYQISNPRT
jgi:hypothetical protein